VGILSWFKKEPKVKAVKCGHMTRRKGKVRAFGYKMITTIRMDVVEYCHDCLGEMACQCAWCGKPIFIGDPLTIMIPAANEEKMVLPKAAVIYSSDPLQLVGCMRHGCCADTAADCMGIWMPPGVVQLRESVYSRLSGKPIRLVKS
jgi:hypothetical protein